MEDWQKTKEEFLKLWTLEKVGNMTLEEYTNLDKSNSFAYWLESKTSNVVGIGGGSAYKFGIFKRQVGYEKKKLKSGQNGNNIYGWYEKYGDNQNDVFEKVKSLIIQTIQHSQYEKFHKIDDIDLGTAYKWKIAFMYAPKETLLRIVSKKAFLFLAKKYNINSKLISEIQKELIKLKSKKMSFYDYSSKLWNEFERGEIQEKINYEKEFSEWNLITATRNEGEVTENRNLAMIEKLRTQIPKLIKDDINLFEINDITFLKKIKKRFSSNGDLNSSMKGNNNANCSSSLHRYIKFLEAKMYEINKEEYATSDEEIEKNIIDNKEMGNIDFSHKNILLKGVPGTGKSKTIDNIIKNNLDMSEISNNVLRINIHSASSNSDLMQGISISTNDNNDILYQEKRGAVLKHIFKAMYKPNQPFVLVLEEIQENSLNELIGDLIYLIEKDKRTVIELDDRQELSYDELFNKVKPMHFVELPNLVENSESNTKMIMPDNLYVFCTSNYRDDRKVIEDNLLRRFDVVEIYPQYQDKLGKEIFKSKDVSDFLEKLNESILKQFKNETHPDRYLVGHANWLKIEEDDKELFYTALLKVIIEFKEIREVDFNSYVKPILQKLFKKDNGLSDRINSYLEIFYDEDKLKLDSYKSLVEKLQAEIYNDFL